MNSELDELLSLSEHVVSAAPAIVRWAREDRARLVTAAEAWIERARDSAERPSMYGEEEPAILCLLGALPGASTQFEELLAIQARPGQSPSWDELELLIAIAPARATPAQWRDRLLAAVRSGKGLPSGVIHFFAESMPGLAYELLEAFETSGRMKAKANSYAVALSVYRRGLEPSFTHGQRHLSTLTAERVLNDDTVFGFTLIALHANRPGPPQLDEVKALAFASGENQDRNFLRGLHLLAAQRQREDVVSRLCAFVGSASDAISRLVKAAHGDGRGLFRGWGQDEPTRLLGKFGRALLEAGQWPSELWNRTLKLHLLDRTPTTKRERDILAESLFQIADDPAVPLPDRRRALEALGKSGAGGIAARMGKIKATTQDLVEDVKRTRNQLARSGKGHEVDPENGLRLAVNHMLRRGLNK